MTSKQSGSRQGNRQALPVTRKPVTPNKPTLQNTISVLVADANYPLPKSNVPKDDEYDDGVDTIPATQYEPLPGPPKSPKKTAGAIQVENCDAHQTQTIEEEEFIFQEPGPPAKKAKNAATSEASATEEQSVKEGSASSSILRSLSTKINGDYDSQSGSAVTKVGHIKVSGIALLVWNYHISDEQDCPSKMLIDFMHNGRTQFTIDFMQELVNRVSHRCNSHRYVAALCLLQTIKHSEEKEMLQLLEELGKEGDPVNALIRTSVDYFRIKKNESDSRAESHQKDNLLLTMKKLMDTAVETPKGNCGNCKVFDKAVFALKCKNLFLSIAISNVFVNPLEELLENLCEFASRPAVEIQSELDQYNSKSLYVHSQVLELWTGRAESPRIIRTETPIKIIQNTIYLLYYDTRMDIPILFNNHAKFIELCGRLQIPDPWSLLELAGNGETDDFSRCDIVSLMKLPLISPSFLNYLLRTPDAWISNEAFLQQVSLEKMKLLVGSDDLCMEEIDVLYLCHRWAKVSREDSQTALALFETIKEEIRFPLIPTDTYWDIFKTKTDTLLDTLRKFEICSAVGGDKTGTTMYNGKPRKNTK